MKNSKPNLSMDVIRTEIDRVDMALLDLIAERMELAQAVRRAKSGVDVWRPSREESHVRDLAQKAGDIPPKLVSRIWAELTSASLTLQGPIRLHIARGVDSLSASALVRDRFGGAIPTSTYPTDSAALAAAYIDPEGVAILPAPGRMCNWWTALGPNGAAPDMHILAALPRISDQSWPMAVALSKAECLPSGSDQTLLYVQANNLGAMRSPNNVFKEAGLGAVLRAELQGAALYSIAEHLEKQGGRMKILQNEFAQVKIIGIMPLPMPLSRGTEKIS